MADWQVKTPIAFIIFNRPDTTEKVFEAIRKAQPTKLLVISDGPRSDRAGEAEKCEAARAIIERVDWNCQVLTNYSDINLGCKNRVSSGLDWVFNTVEEAIILEDDCLPHPTFFRFCDELLEKYRDDKRIMCVSGTSYQFGTKVTDDSYYFSRYPHIWGWATWRRAWQYYDIEMKLWPQLREGDFLKDLLIETEAINAWKSAFQASYDNTVNNWGFRWTYACWVQNALSITPKDNLVSNIGFGEDATHTANPNSKTANMSVEPMSFPLKHPSGVIRNWPADRVTQNVCYDYAPSILKRVKRRIKKVIKV